MLIDHSKDNQNLPIDKKADQPTRKVFWYDEDRGASGTKQPVMKQQMTEERQFYKGIINFPATC